MKGKVKILKLTTYNTKEKSYLIFNFYYVYLLQFSIREFV